MQFNNPASTKKPKYDNSTLNKINRPVAFAACSRSHPARVRLLYTPREGTRSQSGTRMEAIPTATRRKDKTRSIVSPAADITRRLVFCRSLATHRAASTPALALRRFLPTQEQQYGHWRGSAFKQHHRRQQHGQRSFCALQQHHRLQQHSHW